MKGSSTTTRKDSSHPLGDEELHRINAWWRACNYLSVGMIYLRGNPLLKEPLGIEHVKHRLLGHWRQSGTVLRLGASQSSYQAR